MLELSARPLRASALDAELFVNREHELEALGRSVNARLNALVVGAAGVGKTSLLHQLERRLEDDAQLAPIFVEGTRSAKRPEELLALLAYRLGADRPRLPPLGETPAEELLAVLSAVREALSRQERRALLILDELPAGELAHALFGQLRDELWSLSATWVVATETGEQAAYLRPPASAFFETTIDVAPLTQPDARELLRRRTPDAEVPAAVLKEVADAADGNPRRLVELARQVLLEGRSVEDATSAHARLRGRARELGEAASRLVAYLDAHGAASASDERMLSELGWGRSRATQVLRQLEQAGLVQPTSERGESGRRKVYTLAAQGGEPG